MFWSSETNTHLWKADEQMERCVPTGRPNAMRLMIFEDGN